jgi:hypothetical protein
MWFWSFLLALVVALDRCSAADRPAELWFVRRSGECPWNAVIAATEHWQRPILLSAADVIIRMMPIVPGFFTGPKADIVLCGLHAAMQLTHAVLSALDVPCCVEPGQEAWEDDLPVAKQAGGCGTEEPARQYASCIPQPWDVGRSNFRLVTCR